VTPLDGATSEGIGPETEDRLEAAHDRADELVADVRRQAESVETVVGRAPVPVAVVR